MEKTSYVHKSLENPADTTAWDAFVSRNEKGTPFHLTTWIRTIQQTYRYELSLLAKKNRNGKIECVFPCFKIKSLVTGTRYVSLPFSDYGGPLCEATSDGDSILQYYMQNVSKRNRYLEIRGDNDTRIGIKKNNYYKRHILTLDNNPSQVLKKIDKRTIQYSIRKGNRDGISIKEDNTEVGIEEFIALNELTRKKHGMPSQPRSFFINMYRNMILTGQAFILTATFGSTVIAAGFFLRFRDTIYYKYNASHPEFLSRMTPNHLLTWHAIEDACLKGYRNFDFGRTSPDNIGLIRYKEMWGTRTEDLTYCYYPEVRGFVSKEERRLQYRIFTNVWRSLPKGISNRIGPYFYKHLG